MCRARCGLGGRCRVFDVGNPLVLAGFPGGLAMIAQRLINPAVFAGIIWNLRRQRTSQHACVRVPLERAGTDVVGSVWPTVSALWIGLEMFT